MPDQTGKLSDSERERIKGWITDRIERCPACRTAWNPGSGLGIGTHVVSIPVSTSLSTSYTAIMGACVNCGHIELLTGSVMALLEKPPE